MIQQFRKGLGDNINVFKVSSSVEFEKRLETMIGLKAKGKEILFETRSNES